MKREIKFRAWARIGDWEANGEKQSFTMIDADSLMISEDLLKDGLKEIDDEYYVMQFTGLKDKNGKEIYEGDIIIRKLPPPWDNHIALVEFNNQTAMFTTKREDSEYNDTCLSDDDWEVIGNIYENPELL